MVGRRPVMGVFFYTQMGLHTANQTSFQKGHIPAAPFKKGQIPWNKGVSMGTGDKHFNWKGGLPNCSNCDKILSQRHSKSGLCVNCFRSSVEYKKKAISHLPKNTRGEKNPNWKGGTYGTERHRDMGRIEYKNWRMAVFKRDGFRCVSCKTTKVFLNADHIKPWSLYPALRYDINNGRTLCVPCHMQTETWGHRSIYRGRVFA